MARVRGSKDGKIIHARFNGSSKSLFPTLKQTKALILLSIVGNEFCSGEYLKAIINTAVSTHQFVTFLIADEVYWHNLCHDFSKSEEELAKQQAHLLGIKYLEQNLKSFFSIINTNSEAYKTKTLHKDVYEQISIINSIAKDSSNFEIICWKDWINRSTLFRENQNEIMALYNTEESLNCSIKKTANNFSNRHQNEDCSIDLLNKRSKGYLIEESPAVIWIAAERGYNFIVYPGEMMKPFKATKDFFIKKPDHLAVNDLYIRFEQPELLVNWLEVSFQRSHEKKSLFSNNNQSNFDHQKIILNSSKITTNELMKGITEGVFALDLEETAKIKLIVEIMAQYEQRNKSSALCFANQNELIMQD